MSVLGDFNCYSTNDEVAHLDLEMKGNLDSDLVLLPVQEKCDETILASLKAPVGDGLPDVERVLPCQTNWKIPEAYDQIYFDRQLQTVLKSNRPYYTAEVSLLYKMHAKNVLLYTIFYILSKSAHTLSCIFCFGSNLYIV